MFRFVHAADIHLDSPLRGLSRYESAPVDTIRGATRRAFGALVDLAIEEDVAFVLLAGDLFDGGWRDFNTGIFLSRELGRLDRAGIRTLAVLGNHDAASKMTRSLELPPSTTIFASREPELVTLDDLGVTIAGQSFATAHVHDNLAASFPLAPPEGLRIGLLHTSLTGREGHADYAPCTIDDLASKGYDYWALGHVHTFEVVARDPWVVYPGCVQGRHIRETGPKGAVVVTVEDDRVQAVEHRPLDVVRWARVTVDCTDRTTDAMIAEALREALETSLDEADDRPLALRLDLHGVTTLARELTGHPRRLHERAHMIAAAIAEDDLWIEKVTSSLQPPRTPRDTLPGGHELGELLRAIEDDTGGSPPEGADELVRALAAKLPAEALDPDVGIALDDEHVIEQLMARARKLLADRLSTMGGA